MKGFIGILSTVICLPMWFYLLHYVLSATDAPTMVWGIYWAYVPFSFIFGVMIAASKDS